MEEEEASPSGVSECRTDYAVLYSTREYKKVRPVYFTPDVAEWERRFVRGVARGNQDAAAGW